MSSAFADTTDNELQILITALRSGRLSAPFTAISVGRLFGDGDHQSLIDGLQELWNLQFTELQIAACLELVVSDRFKRPRIEDLIDLVTTGPDVPGIISRDTSVVVRDLFSQANHSVLIAGYAIHQGKQVFHALLERMREKGELRARMFVDIRREFQDASPSSDLLRQFKERFRTEHWPAEAPTPAIYYDPRSLEVAKGVRSALHAKCVVVDGAITFISSANFTEAAHERNIEVGLLVRSTLIAKRVVEHFDTLVENECLVRLY